jgi:hypothetical protein
MTSPTTTHSSQVFSAGERTVGLLVDILCRVTLNKEEDHGVMFMSME